MIELKAKEREEEKKNSKKKKKEPLYNPVSTYKKYFGGGERKTIPKGSYDNIRN